MKKKINMGLVLPALALVTSGTISNPSIASDTKPLNYSYIEGAFVHDNFNSNGVVVTDRDGMGNTADDNFGQLGESTGNGGAARLSFALPFGGDSLGFHVVTDYLQTSHTSGIAISGVAGGSIGAGTVDLNQREYRLALGFHTKADDTYSIFGELGLTSNKVAIGTADLDTVFGALSADLSPASGNRTALTARVGARFMATSRTEILGYVRYHGNGSIEAADDGTIGFAGKVKIGAGAFYNISSGFKVGGDYEFGRPGRLRLVARLSF